MENINNDVSELKAILYDVHTAIAKANKGLKAFEAKYNDLTEKFDLTSEIDKQQVVEEEVVPVQEEVVPVQEEASPVQEEVVPVQEEASPVQEEVVPVQEEAAPVQEEAPAVTEESASVQEEAPAVTEEAAPVQEEAPAVTEEVAPVQEEAPAVTEEAAPVQEEAPAVTEEAAPVQEEPKKDADTVTDNVVIAPIPETSENSADNTVQNEAGISLPSLDNSSAPLTPTVDVGGDKTIFKKEYENSDKAILVNIDQGKKLRSSKEEQKKLFEAKEAVNDATPQQELEGMVNEMQTAYSNGELEKAESISKQIEEKNKTFLKTA